MTRPAGRDIIAGAVVFLVAALVVWPSAAASAGVVALVLFAAALHVIALLNANAQRIDSQALERIMGLERFGAVDRKAVADDRAATDAKIEALRKDVERLTLMVPRPK